MEQDIYLTNILRHIKQLRREMGWCGERQLVSAILLELRMNTKQPGFEYLCCAVGAYRKNPAQLITKELYPAVARACRSHVEPGAVERGIRAAIDATFRSCSREVWQMYFRDGGSKPSNTEFISMLARLIDLCMEEEV